MSNCRDGNQWQWYQRYRQSNRYQPDHSDQRIKKQEDIEVVNYRLLEQLDVETIDVDLYPVESAEMDEMWSFVGRKKQQRWLWHAIDHISGDVLAYVLAPHQD